MGAGETNLTHLVATTVTAQDITAAKCTAASVVIGDTAYGARLIVTANLVGTTAATAANYGVFFIAPVACKVLAVRQAHTTKGTDTSAVTLDIEKLVDTEAPDAGVAVLGATKISLKGDVNTVQAPDLTGTTANKQLAIGDRLCLKDAGVLTAVAGLHVTVELEALPVA